MGNVGVCVLRMAYMQYAQGVSHVTAVKYDVSSYFMYLFFQRVDEIASV